MSIDGARACVVCLALAGTANGHQVGPAGSAEGSQWAVPFFPLAAGRLELRGGAGFVQSTLSPGGQPWIVAILSARLGVAERLQIALPLLFSFTLAKAEWTDAVFVVSAGAQGVGWSPVDGAVVVPLLQASGHWHADPWTAVVTVGAATGGLSLSTIDTDVELNLGVGVSRRISDRVSVSMSANGTFLARAASGRSVASPVRVAMGGLQLSPAAVAPSVRVRLIASLSLEGVVSAVTDFRGNLGALIGVSLSWAPRLWGGDAAVSAAPANTGDSEP